MAALSLEYIYILILRDPRYNEMAWLPPIAR